MSGTYRTIGTEPVTTTSSAINLAIQPEVWMQDASCRETGGDEFFQDAKNYKDARKICFRCPVMEQCGEFAIRTHINEGMFGGMSPVERKAKRRKSNLSRKPRRQAYGPPSAVDHD